MDLRHPFLLLLIACYISSASAQAPSRLIPIDLRNKTLSNIGGQPTPAGSTVVVPTRNAPWGSSTTSLPPGSKFISITKGDSTLAAFTVGDEIEMNAIVQFRSPPLSTLGSFKDNSRTARLQSAISAARADHGQFKSDLPAIEATLRSQSRVPFATPVATIRYEYVTALNGVAITADRRVLDGISKLPYVESVDEDVEVKALDDSSNALIEAPLLWNIGIHGDSIDIGIIDTGIDYFHEALGGAAFPNSKVVGGYDFVHNDNDPLDDNGHGTHVAGIAAGKGPGPTNLRGVAYEARLWAFKVLDAFGHGSTSQVLAGIDRALDPDSNPATPTPIKVLNLSLGGTGNANDPLSRAIDNAVTDGVVCAVAAGNSGPRVYTINSPGCARKALTVGACSNTDVIALFSSRGPSDVIYGIKPDLLAPGMSINSAKNGGGYKILSGTSMATPHAAGAAALIWQLHPSWTAEEIKANLLEGAADLGLNVWTQGNGRLDVFQAAQESTVITPGNISFGFDDITQPIWMPKETLNVHNFASVPELFQFSNESAPPSGITISYNPNPAPVGSNDSATVVMSLAVDSSVFPFPSTNPGGYVNRVIAQSLVTSQRLAMPFAFIKSPILTLKFNTYPTLVDLHNLRDSAFYNLAFSNLNSKTLVVIVPADTYDVVTCFSVDSQIVIKERIGVNASLTVSINTSDAVNPLTVRKLDASGNLITALGVALESFVSKRSRFGISIFGSEIHTGRRISDISSDYKYEISVIPNLDFTHGTFYEFPFLINDGITGPVTLQNDPAAFKRVDYRFRVPPGTTRLSLTSIFSTEALGIGSTLATIYPPFRMTAYYVPESRLQDFPYTQHWLASNPLDILNSMVFRTGYTSVSQPDTMKFSWSPVGFLSGATKFSTRRASLCNPAGFTPSIWAGKIYNLGASIDLQVVTDAYFVTPLGERTTGDLSFQLSAGGSPVSSGIIKNRPRSFLDTSLAVPGGDYELDLTFNTYQVGARQGTATAKITANSNNTTTTCPRFGNFQFLRDGELPDSLPINELRLVPKTDAGGQTVTLSYRRLYDTIWIPLSTSQQDSTYSAPIPGNLSIGYYSLRATITDSHSNALDYTMEPAFTIPTIYLSSHSHEFDTIHAGCQETKILGVQNLRLVGDVTLQSVTSDDSNFAVPTIHNVVIPASDSFKCPVTFTADTLGPKSGHLIFTFAGGFAPETVAVSGVGGVSGREIVMSETLGTRWQLISLPVIPSCPYVIPYLFWYYGRYIISNTPEVGKGYFKKLDDPVLTFEGFPLNIDTIPLIPGWNLIGSLSKPVPTSTIRAIPPTLHVSRFFGFSGAGYEVAEAIQPTHGYWVKVDNYGSLVLKDTSIFHKSGREGTSFESAASLKIVDAANRSRTLYFGRASELPADPMLFELPPIPPDGVFDVRFLGDRLCQPIENGKAKNLPIVIRSAEYPVTISWDLRFQKLVVSLKAGDRTIAMGPRGSMALTSPVDTLMLKVGGSPPAPREFALDANYPNPFNPQTVIQYQLPVDSRVDLRIFNALGQVSETLVNGFEPAGYKSVAWNGSSFASGVYFCRLQAVDITNPSKTFVQVRKLVLLR